MVELALYDPVDGFFGAGAGAGRRADFMTSPEVGPLFGAVIARALDEWWTELGRPDPFTVIEVAAGAGTLAQGVLAAVPECLGALTYVLVERSETLRDRQRERLPVGAASLAFPPSGAEDVDGPSTEGGLGPRIVSLGEMPTLPVTGVVLANELLDNLVVRVLERGDEGWLEVRVGLTGDDLPLVELMVPADEADARLAERLAPDAAIGARLPIQRAAADWLGRALSLVERGRVVVVDYTCPTRPTWPPDRRTSGCAPTGPTAGEALRSTPSAPRTSRARSPSTSSPSSGDPGCTDHRPSSSPPTASTTWSRKDVAVDRAGPPR